MDQQDNKGRVPSEKDYFEELKRRSRESKVYKSYQLTGLEIANILEDWSHKSLYIKLAKQYGEGLMPLAKSVAEKKDVRNKGAYFMKVLKNTYGKNNNNRK